MAESKIEVTVGAVRFSGEGDQAWLADQLDKVLKAAPEIATSAASVGSPAGPVGAIAGGQLTTTLAAHIKKHGGEVNQVDRFLITADWLRLRGAANLTTAAVAKALKANQQKRLANPSDCLNKNVTKGNCEKANGGFFITPDGLKKLGY